MNDENIIEGYKKKISFKISDNLAYQHASLATKKRSSLGVNRKKTKKTNTTYILHNGLFVRYLSSLLSSCVVFL